MKRNLNLVRLILLEIEAIPPGRSLSPLKFDEFESEIIAGHIELLEEAGLIEAQLTRTFNHAGVRVVSNYNIRRLTWEGHDFIENARIKNVWDSFNVILKEKGGDISFSVAKALLIELAKKHFGI
jgi:hypothetical protein